jgi:hypothetical protein
MAPQLAPPAHPWRIARAKCRGGSALLPGIREAPSTKRLIGDVDEGVVELELSARMLAVRAAVGIFCSIKIESKPVHVSWFIMDTYSLPPVAPTPNIRSPLVPRGPGSKLVAARHAHALS